MPETTMPDKTLTPEARAALLLLVAVATPSVRNPDLKERFGVTITGDQWRPLRDLKLAKTAKVGRSLTHEVTDEGWVRARQELTGELPGSKLGRAAVQAITRQLHRYVERAGLRLYDIFVPDDAPVPAADAVLPARDTAVPAGPDPDELEHSIRAAYRSLATKPNAWVILTDLRPLLPAVSKAEVDAALLRLNRHSDVTIAPESNRKSLTPADRAASVRIGRQANHLIAIEGA